LSAPTRAPKIVVVALFVLAVAEIGALTHFGRFATDGTATILDPALAVRHGNSPYGTPTVYPPSAFLPLVPLVLLPWAVAKVVWVLLLLLAATATLWVLGVRDWICYAIWLLNPATLSTIFIGNATILVGLCAALTWRYRRSARTAGLALAGAISTKLFAAPLCLWLIMTRRYRAAVGAGLASTILIAAAWAAIGFDSVSRYPAILNRDTDVCRLRSPFLQGLVIQLGGSGTAASTAALVATLMLLIAATRRHDEIASFAMVAAAAVLLSPVSWVGYGVLLVIPLAVRQPRYGGGWLLLMGLSVHFWWSPLPFGTPALSLVTIVIYGAVTVVAARPQSRGVALTRALVGERVMRNPPLTGAAD
jgi:hypothetical protein